MYYRSQKLKEIFMAWMIGRTLGSKPGLTWSLKDRHISRQREKGRIMQNSGENKLIYEYGIKNCVL